MKYLLIILFLFSFNVYSQDIYTLMEDLQNNYTYRDDMELFGVVDYWQTAEEFEQNKSGDCEDFALYVREKLGKDYYVTTYVIAESYDIAHAVSVVWDLKKDSIYITSNNELIEAPKTIYNNIAVLEWYTKKEYYNLKFIFSISDNCIYGEGSQEMYRCNYTEVKTY